MQLNTQSIDRIDGWNNTQQDTQQSTSNMLRILQNNIINSTRCHNSISISRNNQIKHIKISRPNTSSVQSTTTTTTTIKTIIITDPMHINYPTTIDYVDYGKRDCKSQSLCNNNRNRSKDINNNKQNLFYGKNKVKGQQMHFKKQQLIFANYNFMNLRKNASKSKEGLNMGKKTKNTRNTSALSKKQGLKIMNVSQNQQNRVQLLPLTLPLSLTIPVTLPLTLPLALPLALPLTLPLTLPVTIGQAGGKLQKLNKVCNSKISSKKQSYLIRDKYKNDATFTDHHFCSNIS